jgi:hypothetical protein
MYFIGISRCSRWRVSRKSGLRDRATPVESREKDPARLEVAQGSGPSLRVRRSIYMIAAVQI